MFKGLLAAAALAAAIGCAATPAAAYEKSGEAKGVDTLGLFGPAGASVDTTFSMAAYYQQIFFGAPVFNGYISFDNGRWYDTPYADHGGFNPSPDILVQFDARLYPQTPIGDYVFVPGLELTIYNTTKSDIGFYNVYDPSSGAILEHLELYSPGGAAPEPATWMLLVAGIGMTGAALRWRQHSATTASALRQGK